MYFISTALQTREYTLFGRRILLSDHLLVCVLFYLSLLSQALVCLAWWFTWLVLRKVMGGEETGGCLGDALSVPPGCYHLTKLFAGLLCSSPRGGHNAVFVCV